MQLATILSQPMNWATLQPDLLRLVLGFFCGGRRRTFIDSVPDIASVCKNWNTVLNSSPKLWLTEFCDTWLSGQSDEVRKTREILHSRMHYFNAMVNWQVQVRRWWQAELDWNNPIICLVDLADLRVFSIDKTMDHESVNGKSDYRENVWSEEKDDCEVWNEFNYKIKESEMEMTLKTLAHLRPAASKDKSTAVLCDSLTDLFELAHRVKQGHHFCIHAQLCDEKFDRDPDIKGYRKAVLSCRKNALSSHTFHTSVAHDKPCRRRSSCLWTARPGELPSKDNPMFLETWAANSKPYHKEFFTNHFSMYLLSCLQHSVSRQCYPFKNKKGHLREGADGFLWVCGGISSDTFMLPSPDNRTLPTENEAAADVPKSQIIAGTESCQRWMPPGALQYSSKLCQTCKQHNHVFEAVLCYDCFVKFQVRDCKTCAEQNNAQTGPDGAFPWPWLDVDPAPRPRKRQKMCK
jgi:hypothetical protein